MAETVLSDVCGQTSVRTLPACSFAVWRQSGMNIDEAAEQRVRKRAQSPRSERQPGSFSTNVKRYGYHPLRGFNLISWYLTWGSRPRLYADVRSAD